MIAPRRVRLHVDKRRAQLLQLGIQLFSTKPYEDISIDEVAESAGVSKGLLYHYFQGKRGFYVEAIRAASRELRRLTRPDRKLSPGARLRAGIDAQLDFVEKYGALFAAIHRSGMTIAPEVGQVVEAHRKVAIRDLASDFGIKKAQPVLRAALRAWIAMVEGASLDWIAHPDLDREMVRELLVAGYRAMVAKAAELDPICAAALANFKQKTLPE